MGQKPSVTNQTNAEFEFFKTFCYDLRKEINQNTTSFAGRMPGAMAFEITQEMLNMVTAVEKDIVGSELGMKNEALKIACLAYKMWREL